MAMILLPRALEAQGWQVQSVLRQDGSSRRYARVGRNGKSAVFMDCSGAQTPGHDLGDFIRIAEWLRLQGLSAPDILWTDEASGFALAEDLGDVSLRSAVQDDPAQAMDIYAAAADVLKHIAGVTNTPSLPDFYGSAVHTGHRRVMDWYAPVVLKRAVTDAEFSSYQSILSDLEKSWPLTGNGFVHIDYHAENLMWMPDRTGAARIGILDFQGAMQGPEVYDWVNLLMDARTDVPTKIKAALLKDKDSHFMARFDLMALQFHLRVLGQFIKITLKTGKPDYLAHIPRLEAYIRAHLQKPEFKSLAGFFSGLGLEFDAGAGIVLGNAERLIRADAF